MWSIANLSQKEVCKPSFIYLSYLKCSKLFFFLKNECKFSSIQLANLHLFKINLKGPYYLEFMKWSQILLNFRYLSYLYNVFINFCWPNYFVYSPVLSSHQKEWSLTQVWCDPSTSRVMKSSRPVCSTHGKFQASHSHMVPCLHNYILSKK